MLRITSTVQVPMQEIEFRAIRAQGAGGQNVNKVSSAVQLFFDVTASSLPEAIRERVLAKPDHRVTTGGVVVIKAQEHRSQEKNREAALERLRQFLQSAALPRRKRKPTKPGLAARRRRVDEKVKHSRTKALRGKIQD